MLVRLAKTNGCSFFDDQVKDNAFLTLVPATFIGTLWESLAWWVYANSYAPQISFDSNLIWFVVFIALLPWWSVLYFSVVHWLLRQGPGYTLVHS